MGGSPVHHGLGRPAHDHAQRQILGPAPQLREARALAPQVARLAGTRRQLVQPPWKPLVVDSRALDLVEEVRDFLGPARGGLASAVLEELSVADEAEHGSWNTAIGRIWKIASTSTSELGPNKAGAMRSTFTRCSVQSPSPRSNSTAS